MEFYQVYLVCPGQGPTHRLIIDWMKAPGDSDVIETFCMRLGLDWLLQNFPGKDIERKKGDVFLLNSFLKRCPRYVSGKSGARLTGGRVKLSHWMSRRDGFLNFFRVQSPISSQKFMFCILVAYWLAFHICRHPIHIEYPRAHCSSGAQKLSALFTSSCAWTAFCGLSHNPRSSRRYSLPCQRSSASDH
jgi:hypothetical protein